MKAASADALPRFLAACVRAQRRRYGKRLDRCREKFSERAVHELRIQTRRLLALLDLLQMLYAELPLRKTRKAFKRRLDAFDELRDTQVQLRLLKIRRADFPEVRELDAWLRRRESKRIKTLRRGIQATQQARLEQRLKDLEKSLRKRTLPHLNQRGPSPAHAALTGVFSGVVTCRRGLRRPNPATIHRTRVMFKRCRYLAELLRPFLPGATPDLLRRMRRYQTRMGDVQDQEVLLAALALAEEKGRLESSSARRLRRAVKQSRARLVNKYLQSADELFDFDPSRLIAPPAARTPLNHETLHPETRRSCRPR